MIIHYPPEIKIEVVDQETIPKTGFYKILRTTAKAHYTDETVSKPFVVDSVLRDRLDAVAILGHFLGEGGRFVYLRSCLRPALSFRDYEESKRMEDKYVGNMYEIPAGLVELDELGMLGLKQAASREFEEEIGFKIEPVQMKFLGNRIFPAVAMAAERIFFLEVSVLPSARKEPTLDGHPLEDGGVVKAVLLSEAMEMVSEGYITDAKTEIGLRRLVDKYGFS